MNKMKNMNKLKLSILVLAATALLTGCATAPIQHLSTDRTFQAPKNVVWPLLIAEVGLNYPVKALEKESGLITTDFVSPIPGPEICAIRPFVLLGCWNNTRMTLSALVTEPMPGTTHVVIRMHFEAFEFNTLKSWMVCTSTGWLEHKLLDKIGEQLPKTPATTN